MPCELVIFDCDGTIMDTEMLAAEVEAEHLREYGSTLTAADFARRFSGVSTPRVKEVMEEELGRALPEDFVRTVRNRMNERLWREATAMAGIHDVLDAFDQPRCVCSNAEMKKLEIEMKRGELWDRFRPYVFSAEDLNLSKKPAPDVFAHAAQEFEVDPSRCLVLEDSIVGVEAARAAGMVTIGFTGGSHAVATTHDDLTEAGAMTVIKRLADLPALIEGFDALADLADQGVL